MIVKGDSENNFWCNKKTNVKKGSFKMKKFLAILLVMMMSVTVCSAEVVLFPDGETEFGSCFTTSSTWNKEQTRVMYDETTTDTVIAYHNADGATTAARIGTITFPETYSEDGISFEFTAKANSTIHSRAKLFFKDSEGNTIFDAAFRASDSGKFSFMNGANSGSAISYTSYVEPEAETKLNITFDFTNKKAYAKVGILKNDKWTYSDDYEYSIKGNNFKVLQISNEHALSDASFYNFTLTKPEEEIPDVFENSIYKRTYKEDFNNGAKGFTESVSASRWVKYDETNGNIHAYNPEATGSNAGKLVFDKAITENGAKIAFTYNTDEGHVRMKLRFKNSNNENLHEMEVRYREAVEATEEDPGSPAYNTIAHDNSMISYDLYKGDHGVPVRVEMEFNFTDKTVTYRTDRVTEEGYEMGALRVKKDFCKGASGDISDIKEMHILNEYNYCNVTVDDIEAYVPKLSFVNSSANAEEYAVSYTIRNTTDEAITGDIICAVYDENGSLTEVKMLANATITTTLTDAFIFDIAEDFTNYAIYVWSDIEEMIPVSMGYQSF